METAAASTAEEVETSSTEAPLSDGSPIEAMRVYGNVGATPVTLLSGTTTWRNPTITADGGLLGNLPVAAASIAGLRHRQEGSTGQDAFGFATSEDGATVALAVADGLGSKSRSQLGSAAAARIAAAYLAQVDDESHFDFPRDFAMAAAVEINKQLRQFRSRCHPELDDRDLGTTLAFAWIRRSDQGWRSVVGRIGDTDAFVLSFAGSVDWASPFERGDGALNAVEQSLPVAEPSDLNPDGVVVDLEPGAVLVLTTDGLSEDIRSSGLLRRDLEHDWRTPIDANAMLQSIWYRRAGSHDDRTAIVAWIPETLAPVGAVDGDSLTSVAAGGAEPEMDDTSASVPSELTALDTSRLGEDRSHLAANDEADLTAGSDDGDVLPIPLGDDGARPESDPIDAAGSTPTDVNTPNSTLDPTSQQPPDPERAAAADDGEEPRVPGEADPPTTSKKSRWGRLGRNG